MKHCKPDRPGDRLHEEELERLRAMFAHNDIAAAIALHHCSSHGICPPPWAVSGASELLIELLRHEVSSKRGRAAGRVARYRQDLIDFERWCTVDYIRRMRAENKKDLKILKECPPDEDHSYVQKTRDWLRNGVFECASMLLRDFQAGGGVHAVRASYRRVERRRKSHESALRCHVTFGDFLKQVGLEWPGSSKAGTKFVPLYDLTP